MFKSTTTFSPDNLLFYEIYFLQLEHTLQSDFIVCRLDETIYQTKVVFDFTVETRMYFVMTKVGIFMHLQIFFKSMQLHESKKCGQFDSPGIHKKVFGTGMIAYLTNIAYFHI